MFASQSSTRTSRLRSGADRRLRRERSPACLSFIDKIPSLGKSGCGLGAVLHQNSEAILRWFSPLHTTYELHGNLVTITYGQGEY